MKKTILKQTSAKFFEGNLKLCFSFTNSQRILQNRSVVKVLRLMNKVVSEFSTYLNRIQLYSSICTGQLIDTICGSVLYRDIY